jgi:hypothetical protein
MQLSTQGNAVMMQLRDNINHLKSDVGFKQLIFPSIDLLYTSISARSREQLRQRLVAVGCTDAAYFDVIEEYQLLQKQYVFDCIDSIVNVLQILIDDKTITDIYFNKLLDFIEYEQLSIIAIHIDMELFDKLNPAIKLRLIYLLVDYIYMALSLFRAGNNIIITQDFDQNFIKKIDKVTIEFNDTPDKRQQLYPLFFSELHIREASILATGELVRHDQLSDIFTVYKTASYGLSNVRQQDNTVSYYNLAIKTLSQLSKASSYMQSRSGQQLSVVIQPMSHETAIGHHGLVRRSIFGVHISYQDTQGLILDINASPGFNHVYRASPLYKLDGELKIAYLAHIRQLTAQVNSNPKHIHYQRRQEKLAALEYIVQADDQGDLSPETFAQVKVNKPYLFVAWGESKTQNLIECAQSDVKTKMLRKMSKEKESIGQLGYSLTDDVLVKRLSEKYLSFTDGIPFDVNKKIIDLISPDPSRQHKTGHELWRYDKKLALEIILIAHAQQLLHPALLKVIEEQYSTLYERSFWFFNNSEVELLVIEVKNNILSIIWADATNDTVYNSNQNAGGNQWLRL